MKTTAKKQYTQASSKPTALAEPAVAYTATAPTNYDTYILQDRYSLVKKSKEGVTTEIFYNFADKIKISEKHLASLINLSYRTISNYKLQGRNLEANYSEHLLKLIALFELGKEYLGSYDDFKKWLERPFWSTDEKPEDFLNTPGGVDLIINRLEKMAQGYPV